MSISQFQANVFINVFYYISLVYFNLLCFVFIFVTLPLCVTLYLTYSRIQCLYTVYKYICTVVCTLLVQSVHAHAVQLTVDMSISKNVKLTYKRENVV
jgi:hypothetical protein